MLTMAVAASAFAACNKQETTPVVNETAQKSVRLNLTNILPATKTLGETIEHGTSVQLNNFTVFFTDGTTLYTPKYVDGSALKDNKPVQTSWTFTKDNPFEADTYEFHFLPKAVDQVIVVGNYEFKTLPTTYDALEELIENVTVSQEQKAADLLLFGTDTSLENSEDHVFNEEDPETIQHPDPYVVADIDLFPTVARFEVVGFEYAQAKKVVKDPETGAETVTNELLPRNYELMNVDNLSVRNYYVGATLSCDGTIANGALDALANNGAAYTTDNVYVNYFSPLAAAVAAATEDDPAWYSDALEIDLNASAPVWGIAQAKVPTTDYKNPVNAYVYHVLPGVTPYFMVKLTGENPTAIAGQTTKSPLYLQTNNFAGLGTITAGSIYRMCIKFDDSNLQQPEKCVKVDVSVDTWDVTVVTPEF